MPTEIKRWNGKGFTSVRFTGEVREALSADFEIFVAEHSVFPTRVYRTPFVATPKETVKAAVTVDIWGKAKRIIALIKH